MWKTKEDTSKHEDAEQERLVITHDTLHARGPALVLDTEPPAQVPLRTAGSDMAEPRTHPKMQTHRQAS